MRLPWQPFPLLLQAPQPLSRIRSLRGGSHPGAFDPTPVAFRLA